MIVRQFNEFQYGAPVRMWLPEEHVEEELREHWYEDSSYQSMWLGRAIVNMRRGWKRKDGTLYAVPSNDPGISVAA